MSVRVMAMVFERYPNGGGEMLLALALADHAHDDGTNIRPSVAHLATKTRQSTRSVQYQLRDMENSGWLELVNSGNGGRNQRREYRINAQWIKGAEIAPLIREKSDTEKGAEIAPLESGKGAIHDTKGCNSEHERVQSTTEKGAKLLHPHRTISEPSLEPSLEPCADRSVVGDSPHAHAMNPLAAAAHFTIAPGWEPSSEFVGRMRYAGIPTDTPWRDYLPEFVLFWSARGERKGQGQWEHKFLQDIQRKRHMGGEPQPLPSDWTPNPSAWELLIDEGVDLEFAEPLLAEFALAQRESQRHSRNWSTEFLEFVRARWARRPRPLALEHLR